MDANGILDSTIDMDLDGIIDSVDNAVGAQGTLPDVDGDGIPNHADDDDDGDGILDVDENPQQQYFTGQDADSDGIDDGVDQSVNGVLEGTDTNNNGVRDDRELLDLDGDGVADYLDADSDNDGILDGQDMVVNVGHDVKSGGAGTMSIMMMLSLLLLSARRYSRSVLRTAVVLLLWLSTTISHAQNWQVNLGLGQSSLNPDLASGLETSNGNDRAVQLGLGYRISSDWLVELRYSDLGEAVIRGNQKHSTLGYQSWVLDTKYQLPLLRGTGWSPYVMGGMAITRLQADDLSLEKKADSGLMVGTGISYRFQDFQLNSELIRYSDGISGWFMGIQKDF
jgi:opacity protein-like surface antigen